MQWPIRGRSEPPGPGREPDALAAGLRPPARGDPGRPARARRRARRGRARRAARRQPRADPRGDRPARGRGARHRPAAPRRGRPLALEGRVPRAVPGARGARDDGRPARRAAADRRGLAALEELIDAMAAHAERDEVAEFFEANAAFHARLVEASGNAKLQRAVPAAARPASAATGCARCRCAGTCSRSVAEHARDPARGQARRRRAGRAPDVASTSGCRSAGSKGLSDEEFAAVEGGRS